MTTICKPNGKFSQTPSCVALSQKAAEKKKPQQVGKIARVGNKITFWCLHMYAGLELADYNTVKALTRETHRCKLSRTSSQLARGGQGPSAEHGAEHHATLQQPSPIPRTRETFNTRVIASV